MTLAQIGLPASTNTVRVRMFDTTTNMSLRAEYFVSPVRQGHETLNLTDVGFLIENEEQNRRILFDLGCKREYWKSPPSLRSRIERIVDGIRVDKDASELLVEAGVDLKDIDTVIWSHSHFDHIGDMTRFPPSTKLVVGPGFSEAFLPAYPENPDSRIDSNFFKDREMEEISLQNAEHSGQHLQIAGLDAIDYLGDGSLYLLSAPGHLAGHICGLARTTEDTFIFMGADVAHFPGVLRPAQLVPLPELLPESLMLDSRFYQTPCPCSAFEHLRSDSDKSVHKTEPFYDISRSEHSAYSDRERAIKDIQSVQILDASSSILVCLAHDPTLLEVLPTLNREPSQDLNQWKEKSWKEQCRWRFLNQLPRVNGLRGMSPQVEGIWKDGRQVGSIS